MNNRLNKIKMVEVKYVLSRVTGIFCLSALLSCSSHDDSGLENPKSEDSNQMHTCELILNVTKSCYSDEPETRSAGAWQNGDKIYLTFNVGEDGKTNGEAIFNDGKWSVNFYGSLTEGNVTKCTAVYFENADYESGSMVKLTEQTGIYEDLNGSYTYANESLSVTADLKPKTARIRFAGDDNTEFTFYGMSYYSAYDCTTGDYSSNMGSIEEKVESGYSPYVYGFFPDDDFRCFNIITAESGFNRPFSATFFNPGESGYMSIPTLSEPKGWQNSMVLKVNGVEFRMIPVTYEKGNFFLAETETTENLWSAVMGGTLKSNLPASNHYDSDWEKFFTSLNAVTDLVFRYPKADEWKYAAAGGNRSQNFIYSGSNFIGDVAWYEKNSNRSKHEVRQLQPNELGFYDMSGNIIEVIKDAGYFSYGGGYNSSETACTINSYSSGGAGSSEKGVRIAMSNPYNTNN